MSNQLITLFSPNTAFSWVAKLKVPNWFALLCFTTRAIFLTQSQLASTLFPALHVGFVYLLCILIGSLGCRFPLSTLANFSAFFWN